MAMGEVVMAATEEEIGGTDQDREWEPEVAVIVSVLIVGKGYLIHPDFPAPKKFVLRAEQ
jgi:hypothetical protein